MSLTKVTYSMIADDVVNVKDYGAVGDNTNDDAPAFIAALATGKSVFIPDGEYTAATLTYLSPVPGQRIFGESRGNTILRKMGFTVGSNLVTCDDVTIENMTLRPDNIYHYGIISRHSKRLTFRDLTIIHCYDGITFFSPNALTTLQPCEDCLVENVYVEKAARIGFTADLFTHSTEFFKCHVDDSKQGFHLEVTDNIVLRDCIASDCGLAATFVVPDSEQPDQYAGPFLIQVADQTLIDNLQIPSRAGQSTTLFLKEINGLTLQNCVGLGRISHQAPSAAIAKNITITNCDDVGYVTDGIHVSLQGSFIFTNNNRSYTLTGPTAINRTLLLVNSTALENFVVENSVIGRIQSAGVATYGTCVLRNVKSQPNAVSTVNFPIVYIDGYTQYVTDQFGTFPNLGIRIDMNITKVFIGRGMVFDGDLGGFHLEFTNTTTNAFELGILEPIAEFRAFGINRNGGNNRDMKLRVITAEFSGSDEPTTGEWYRGDIVWNNAPSAGSIPGWICVTDGSPGTWKAMANLAA